MIAIAKPLIGVEEKEAVQRVLDSGTIAQGPAVAKFEERFSGYVGAGHGVACSSGTTGLHLALLASGVGAGDEVITTPFSFIATANSILYCNAKPIFADIDQSTFNIDPLEVRRKITPRTRAVLVVHLYGQPCEMDEIQEICEEHELRLIEDACQAHGAEYKGRKAGSIGDCGVFSFYPTKNMTTGEGGMITTNDEEIGEQARLLREHGSRIRYHHDLLGYNYRMTDLAAAIGLEQLKKLDGFNQKRRDNAQYITRLLEGVKGIETPILKPDRTHVFHQYTIRVTDGYSITRDDLAIRLKEHDVDTGIYYPLPIHKQPIYGNESRLPVSEKASSEVLSLPIHPSVSNEDLEEVAGIIERG